MKRVFYTGLYLMTALLAGCQTSVLSLAEPEDYSLERDANGIWRVNHDSEYYRYFNKVHQTYHLLLQDAKDPAEQRRLYIERDRKIAEQRLGHMADPRLVKQVVGATRLRSGANPTGHLFRMNDVEHVPRQDFTPADPSRYVYRELTPAFGFMSTDAMTAIIQFDRQLKKRGVTLIVVPVPNAVQLHTHKLHNDIRLEDVVWHPWAHMIAKLLEYDVEVIDLLDLYKTYNGDNTTINYVDHHWGQAGLDIVSWELAQRLKRFRFDERYYLNPADIKRVPLTIKTPALIPFWDKLDIADIAASMPYSPTYQTVRITYRGGTIRPAGTFEDSPVLIMGDSFIFHGEETSSGIYAHLAYHARLIPAQFSRNAAAADPPEWYRASVAGKGREPKVVIWEMYGSAFEEFNSQNRWMVVNMPDPPTTTADAAPLTAAREDRPAGRKGFTVTPDRKPAWIAGEVIRVSEIPNLKKIDYPDALYSFQVRVTDKLASGMEKGKTVVVYRQFMENYTLLKDAVLKKGDRRYFYLEQWLQASRSTDKIGTMQLIDNLDDFESDVYYSHFQDARPGTQLKKLNKAYLDGEAVARAPAAKDGNRLETLAFKLDRLALIEGLTIRLRRGGAAPMPFSLETSIDGKNWISLYECAGVSAGNGVEHIVLDALHPALYIRFAGSAVRKEIVLDGADGSSGIEIYGY